MPYLILLQASLAGAKNLPPHKVQAEIVDGFIATALSWELYSRNLYHQGTTRNNAIPKYQCAAQAKR